MTLVCNVLVQVFAVCIASKVHWEIGENEGIKEQQESVVE